MSNRNNRSAARGTGIAEANRIFQQGAAQRQADTNAGLNDVWKLSAQQMRKIIGDAGTDVDANDRDPYGDGDQSPLSSTNQEKLWSIWCAGGDFMPLVQNNGLSPFGMCCFIGDASGIEQMLQSVQGEEKRHMLERRESITRVTPLMICVLGAKMLFGNKGPEWAKAAAALVKHGAQLNAKDIAGHTACFHASSEDANTVTLDLLKLLIEAKGDVNATNRVGRNALFAAILGDNMPALTALLACGANLHIVDVHGDRPIDAARAYPAAFAAISAFTKSADARASWRTEHRACAACGTARERMLRCSRCSAAFYCDAACQRRHWPTHKQPCAAAAAAAAAGDDDAVLIDSSPAETGVLAPAFGGPGAATAMRLTVGPVRAPAGAVGGTFVVKVQAGGEEPDLGSALVYDETRAVCVLVPPSHPRAADVRRAVAELGLAGVKAYFHAGVTDDGRLRLLLNRPAAPKTW